MGVLGIAAIAEALKGVVLLICPAVLVHLLFGARSSAGVTEVGRVAGIALVALGSACWPGRAAPGGTPRALLGILIYSLLVAVYFVLLGIRRESVGILLWPAALLHGALTVMLARALSRAKQRS
jgi:hypothetical protein